MNPTAGIRSNGAAESVAVATAALCAMLLPATLLAAMIDPRTLNDISVWVKPLKFQFSFALHWLTLALLLPCIESRARDASTTLRVLRAAGFATLVELLYITLQAARARASHFNSETTWEAALYYGMMGPAAVVIVMATAWLGWQVWRQPAPRIGGGLALGAALGLSLSGVLTLVVTAPLAAGVVDGPGHWVGGLRSDASGLPLFGWSTTGGDLRVPHFFATHLLQALPLVGWVSDRLAPRQALRWVSMATGLGLTVIGWTSWQAMTARALLG